jgi:hypothetical protein
MDTQKTQSIPIQKQRNRLPWALVLLVFTVSLVLAACGPDPQPGTSPGGATLVPTATLDAAGYRAVPSPACRIADWTTLESEGLYGDLIAWQPGDSGSPNLAYLAPSERSTWFIGKLMLATGPDYVDHRTLAPGVYVTGDLTWSPAGETLAFLAFRPSENLYTVMTVRADGSDLTDHFPTDLARTDARTSQKAIIGWKNEQTLQVMVSCGEQCRNAFDIRLPPDASPGLTPTPIDDYTELNKALQMGRRVPPFDPQEFPRILSTPMSAPNWSAQDRWVTYLDKRLLLWVLNPEEKTHFSLDIGLRDVSETQWTADESYLSIRAEDRIFVFQVPCQNQ